MPYTEVYVKCILRNTRYLVPGTYQSVIHKFGKIDLILTTIFSFLVITYFSRFTIFWSMIVTYAVAKLFKIVHWLNEPFGKRGSNEDELGELCAEVAYEVLVEALSSDGDKLDVYMNSPKEEGEYSREGSSWLHRPFPYTTTTSCESLENLRSNVLRNLRSKFISVDSPLEFALIIFFILWAILAVIIVHYLPNDKHSEAWWFIYLPGENRAMGYLSRVIGVMFGFLLQDACGRYRRSLTLLTNEIIPFLKTYVYQFPVIVRHHSLHDNDIERFLSHIAVLPVTLKAYSSDTHQSFIEEVDRLLSYRDAQVLKKAPDATSHTLSVIASYIDGADKKFMNLDDTSTILLEQVFI